MSGRRCDGNRHIDDLHGARHKTCALPVEGQSLPWQSQLPRALFERRRVAYDRNIFGLWLLCEQYAQVGTDARGLTARERDDRNSLVCPVFDDGPRFLSRRQRAAAQMRPRKDYFSSSRYSTNALSRSWRSHS